MTVHSAERQAALTFRDLRENSSEPSGGAIPPQLVDRHLPMAWGLANALIPEDPEAAETTCIATFQVLACRSRKLKGRTIIAPWLMRTVWYAAAKERKRRNLPKIPKSPQGILCWKLCQRVLRLKERDAALLVLSVLMNETDERISSATRQKTSRIHLRLEKLTARLSSYVAKLAAGAGVEADFVTLLRAIPVQPPPEQSEKLIERILASDPGADKKSLVGDILSSWRWFAFGRVVKRIAFTLFTVIGVLAATVATLTFLIQTGHLNVARFFVQKFQSELLKEFPGMAEPARPWQSALMPPRNAKELYGTTNIWPVKISMNAEQWKRVQPVNVPPAQSDEGEMPLRNSKASRSGLAGALGFDFRWSDGDFEFAGEKFEKVGIRIRGNGTFLNSLYGPKQSYKIDLDHLKQEKKLAGITKLNFINSIPDFSYLKDALSEKLFRELGAMAPRTSYAYLTIDVPGILPDRPLGLYVMAEGIDSDFARDRFGTKAVPIFKPVTRHLFKDVGSEWKNYQEVYDLKTKATPAQLARVVEMARLVSHANDQEFAAKIPDYLDLEEYAAFVAGHVLLSSYDGYLSNGQNFYLYLDPRSNKFGFIAWDQDHSFGEFAYLGTAEQRENASIWNPATYDNRFLNRVLKVDAFKKVYRQKLEEALAGPFTVERMYREVDALAAIVRPAVAAESKFRLERFEISISTNWVPGPRDAKDDSMKEGPRAPAHQLKRFIVARTQSVRDQLDGKKEGLRVSGFGN